MQLKRFLTLAAFGAILCPASPAPSIPLTVSPVANDIYLRAIRQLGGNAVDPAPYPETVEGFQAFLAASGVKAVSAAELTRPNHPEVAARHGFHSFLPPRAWWPRGAALALLTQDIQEKAGALVHIRNWWRPQSYNTDPAVGGAKNGDHPTASALDLDYATVGMRMKAELFLRQLQQKHPWMQLSFGFGPQTTHVGLASPRGHREWHYAGWRPAIGV